MTPATATARPPRKGPIERYFSGFRAVKSTWAQRVAAERRQRETRRMARSIIYHFGGSFHAKTQLSTAKAQRKQEGVWVQSIDWRIVQIWADLCMACACGAACKFERTKPIEPLESTNVYARRLNLTRIWGDGIVPAWGMGSGVRCARCGLRLGTSEEASSAVLGTDWNFETRPLFSIPVEHGATSGLAFKPRKLFGNWRILRDYFGDRQFGWG